MSAFKLTVFFLIAISAFSLLLISDISLLYGMLLGVLLMLLSYIDIQTFKIPDWLNGIILLVGILYNISIDQLWLPFISFLIAFVFFYSVSIIYTKIRGRQGLGGGDIKLFACGAIWLMPYYLPLVLLISSTSALIYALLSSLYDRKKQDIVPYGPFLALGIWISFLFGESILNYFVIKF